MARTSLSDTLIDRVLALIRDQRLRPGDRLPSARALAQRFAVATPTVREALRRLQATGAVELRHGSGVYVSAALDRVLLPNPNLVALPGERLLHLLDARLLIEPYLAEQAALHCGETEVAELSRRLEVAAGHLYGDDSRLHEANMGFHAAVAAAGGNTVLSEVLESLLAVHGHDQRQILKLFDDRARDYEEHRGIMAAIADRHAADAAALMRTHLADVRSVIASRLAGSVPPNDPPTNDPPPNDSHRRTKGD